MAVRNARETISQALFAVVALAFITSSAAAQAPKTLRYAISSFGEENFDPTAVSIVAGVGVAGGMWDWLTEVSAKGELKPGLATSWSQSEDGKSWTLKLRTDVKFHDGSPMTAEDVRFTFMGGFLREGSKSSRTVQFRKIIADVKVVDANTVRLELNSRWPTLPCPCLACHLRCAMAPVRGWPAVPLWQGPQRQPALKRRRAVWRWGALCRIAR
jgi:peptide/nickel transport system substrate-binding protein